MTWETTIYNAFSGINPSDRNALVRFLIEHTENAAKKEIEDAIEYALKIKPSFGGFIMVAHEDRAIRAAIVANRTGMEGYVPNNIFVFVTQHRDFLNIENEMLALLRQAINHTKGDVALHVKPDNPTRALFEKIGFEAQYLELRLSKQATAVA